ncbi:MAG TPA: hypothetical protein VFE09_05435 [Rubrobacteraceae bacterium]|nr:hypothetical protein [Rubrobacteraceae bacterium]
MLLTKKRRWVRYSRQSVYKKRRRIGLSVLVLLAVLALGGLGSYLSLGAFEQRSEPLERVVTPTVGQAPEAVSEEVAVEKKKAEEEDRRAAAAPADPTLYLTVPRLGLYGHTVRNDRSEAALDLGAIKLPNTGFPWQKEDTNTYIACHRLGWPPAPKATTSASTFLRCRRATRSSSPTPTAPSTTTWSARLSP